MFDLDAFVTECHAVLAADPTFESMGKIVARVVSDPSAIIERFGAPKRAGVEKLFHSADLNILNFVWGPQMTLLPHNHLMRVVIGIYTGREDNIFWRRCPAPKAARSKPSG